MDVFNNFYHNQYLHHHHHQQYYNPTQMPYYYPNEVLYPDYSTFARPNDLQSQPQLYNLEKPIENTDFYLYAPEPAYAPESSDPEIEDILRTNEEVWNTYQTGRFKVVTRYEDNHKKIILKEKVHGDLDDTEYVVRRFKVLVSTPRNSRVKDDHVLLVSFSQKSLNNNSLAGQRLEIEPSAFRHSNQNLIPYHRTESQILSGPGTDLINKIINGEEDSFELVDDGHYEPAYEIQPSSSKESSKYKNKSYFEEKTTSGSSRSSQNPSQSSSSESASEDYIDDIINKIKNQARVSSSVDSRISQSNVSRSQYSGTPFSVNAPADVSVSAATPVSVSYMGGARYVESSKNHQSGSVIQYDGQEYQGHMAEETFGHVSRSSTRNASAHEHHDTHSIGPGSMAGGSLFGGYIPNHVDQGIEKSAFCEYNLTKNEDGDYVLREANGKSEIFDGKSGFSTGMSQFSRGNDSRSNISRLEDKSSRGSKVNIMD